MVKVLRKRCVTGINYTLWMLQILNNTLVKFQNNQYHFLLNRLHCQSIQPLLIEFCKNVFIQFSVQKERSHSAVVIRIANNNW